MIDLHCHILPALDDGAVDLEDSVAMARQAEDDGIAVVCATPHIRADHEVEIGALAGAVADLNAELEGRGIGTRVATGGEVAETALPGLSDRDLALVSLAGGGRWILLEPAPGPLSEGLRHTVAGLAARGFRCVIAHPERHFDAHTPDRLAALVADGALVQVTAAFLEGPDAAAMFDLAARGLVHLLGSDAHSSRFGRPVRLSGGAEALRSVPHVAGHVDWIARHAPAAVARGEDVEPPFRAA